MTIICFRAWMVQTGHLKMIRSRNLNVMLVNNPLERRSQKLYIMDLKIHSQNILKVAVTNGRLNVHGFAAASLAWGQMDAVVLLGE